MEPEMSHYRSNLRDIAFNLFEVLGAEDYYGVGPFAAMDPTQARMLIAEFERFTRESMWAGSFVAADREPLGLSPEGDVTLPAQLEQALREYYDAGWHLLPLPESLGGYGAPPTLRWIAAELAAGGNATASLWPMGPLMSGIIDKVGTDGQRARFARPMVEQTWGATMVLTEPDAGSDVGAGTTRATAVAANGPEDLGSVFHLEGMKRFITSADATPLHANTVHLVLARPEGAAPGTKGLSLFIVPKYLVEADGSLGVRNGVRVSNLEHKMGIKGSATCELSLGQDGTPCIGYLVGDVHDGIKQMFLVIEYARMMVGTKAMATLSTGYLNALDYAKLRQQGADLTRSADKTAPRVPIIDHPDVRRGLMEQKSHAEGMRALVMFTGWVQDMAQVAGEGTEEHATWLKREDLLLPLVKGYCSEKAYELLGSVTLQTFGGSGYTQDYPIEQYVRDAKIDTLYEGTTAIQALDLLFRKIVKDQGQTLTWLADLVRETIKAGGGDDTFESERALLDKALEDAQAHLGVLLTHAMASLEEATRDRIHLAGLQSTAFLFSLAEVVIAWLLLRQGEVAQARLTALAAGEAPMVGHSHDDEVAFYTGKVAGARWFVRNAGPKIAMRRHTAEQEDGALMQVPVAAF
jgi:alkylation response protein AidB-like acyl-CoA dehydrogenase